MTCVACKHFKSQDMDPTHAQAIHFKGLSFEDSETKDIAKTTRRKKMHHVGAFNGG